MLNYFVMVNKRLKQCLMKLKRKTVLIEKHLEVAFWIY